MSTLLISTHPQTNQSVYISNKGDAFYTAKLLAALMGIDTYTLTQDLWYKKIINYATKYPETFITVGFQKATWLIKAEDAYNVINSYIKVNRTNCSKAKELYREMSRVGAKLFAYTLGNYVETKQVNSSNEFSDLLMNIQEKLYALTESTQRLEMSDKKIRNINNVSNENPGCAGVLFYEKEEYSMTAPEYCEEKGITNSVNKISRRTATFQRVGTKREIPKMGTFNLYKVKYLDQALKSVLGL